MTFHEHGFADCLLVLRQTDPDCHDCLCKCEYLVDAHSDFREFEQSLQFLVNFQCHEADADVCLDPSSREVEHRPYLYLWFGYAEGSFHIPQVMICCIDFFRRNLGICKIPFETWAAPISIALFSCSRSLFSLRLYTCPRFSQVLLCRHCSSARSLSPR